MNRYDQEARELISHMSDLLDTAILVFENNCNTPESRIIRGQWLATKANVCKFLAKPMLECSFPTTQG